MNTPNSSNNNHSSFPKDPQSIDGGQKIGKNMLIIAWILGLLILTGIFGWWEEHQINPNRSPETHYSNQAIEVNLKRNRHGHYLTNGMINHQPVTFLIDTGATNVAIPGELQNELGLTADQVTYSKTANGTTTAYNTLIRQLSVGGIQLNNVRASIIPAMEGKEILLGMNVLNKLEFTQRGNELTLRQIH